MPRVSWLLLNDRPRVEIVLTPAGSGQPVTRNLLADTGAGIANSPFELLLARSDCISLAGNPVSTVLLSRAYAGFNPVYLIRVQVPMLGFDHDLPVVGILSPPSGFDGIACFPFLNGFTYGNFGDVTKFGLEC